MTLLWHCRHINSAQNAVPHIGSDLRTNFGHKALLLISSELQNRYDHMAPLDLNFTLNWTTWRSYILDLNFTLNWTTRRSYIFDLNFPTNWNTRRSYILDLNFTINWSIRLSYVLAVIKINRTTRFLYLPALTFTSLLIMAPPRLDALQRYTVEWMSARYSSARKGGKYSVPLPSVCLQNN